MRKVEDRWDSEAEFNSKEHLTELVGREKVGILLEFEILDAAMKGEKALKERWKEMKNNKKAVPCGD